MSDIPMPSYRDWRYNYHYVNEGKIIPNRVGQKFTQAQIDAIVGWITSIGLDAHKPCPSSICVHDPSGNRITIRECGAVGVKREASEARRAARKAEYDKQTDELEVMASSRVSSRWIIATFGDGVINAYNRNALSDFLEGVKDRFTGMAHWTWEDGVRKTDSLDESGNGIDWQKLKMAYNRSL